MTSSNAAREVGVAALPCLSDELLVELMEGRLSSDMHARVHQHAAGCDPCRTLLAAVARGGLAPGAPSPESREVRPEDHTQTLPVAGPAPEPVPDFGSWRFPAVPPPAAATPPVPAPDWPREVLDLLQSLDRRPAVWAQGSGWCTPTAAPWHRSLPRSAATRDGPVGSCPWRRDPLGWARTARDGSGTHYNG